MRRAICAEFTDPVSLRIEEAPTPTPRAGEVLVEVEAAAATFVDGLVARGLYQLRPALPYVPGMALGGRVVAVGEDVESVAVGTRVVALRMDYGGYTTHAVLPAEDLVRLPDGVDPAIAASAVENYSTLLYAVHHRVAIAPGEHVVVLGAGGGIGLAAVDVAHSLGAHVVAVASSADKRSAAKSAGADVVLDYTELKDAIRAATGGGADVVVDPVGGAAAESALRALGAGGRYCVLGFTSGEIPRLPMNIVLLRNRTIVGVDWGDWARDPDRPLAGRDLVAELVTKISRGELHPPAPRTAPLERAGSRWGLAGSPARRPAGRTRRDRPRTL